MTPYFRIFLTLLAVLGLMAWGISKAQTTICRSVTPGYVICTTPPPPPSNSIPAPATPIFDPSVIQTIPDGWRIDPVMLQLILLQKCIQREIQKGYPYYTARQRCLG
jgi:hypothetical protein